MTLKEAVQEIRRQKLKELANAFDKMLEFYQDANPGEIDTVLDFLAKEYADHKTLNAKREFLDDIKK